MIISGVPIGWLGGLGAAMVVSYIEMAIFYIRRKKDGDE